MFVISTLGLAWLFAASRRSAWACRAIACLFIPTALLIAACGTSTPLSTPTEEEAKAEDARLGDSNLPMQPETSVCIGSAKVFDTDPGTSGWRWVLRRNYDENGNRLIPPDYYPLNELQPWKMGFTFSIPGKYFITATRLQAPSGGFGWIVKTNKPPTAALSIASPAGGVYRVGDEVVCDVSASSDPPNQALTYSWDHPGAVRQDPQPGDSPSKLRLKYAAAGTYSISASVADICGSPADTKPVQIADALPAPSLQARFVVREWDADSDDANDPILPEQNNQINAELGLKVTFDSSTSTGDIYRRYWYFSDGTTSTAPTVDKTLSTAGNLTATLLLYGPAYATNSSSDSTINVQGMQLDPDYRMPGLGFYPHALDIEGSTLWSVSAYGRIWRMNLASNQPEATQLTMAPPSTAVAFPISFMSVCRGRIYFPKGPNGVEVYNAAGDTCTLVSPSPISLQTPGESRAIGVVATAAGDDPTKSLVFVATQLPEQVRVFYLSTEGGGTSATLLAAYNDISGIRGLAKCGEESGRRAVVAYTLTGDYYCFDPSVFRSDPSQGPPPLPARHSSGTQLSEFSRSLGNAIAIVGYGSTLILNFRLPPLGEISAVTRVIPASSPYFAFTTDRLYVRDDFKLYKYDISADGARFMESIGAPDQVVKPMFVWQSAGEAKPRLYLGTRGDSFLNGFVRLEP